MSLPLLEQLFEMKMLLEPQSVNLLEAKLRGTMSDLLMLQRNKLYEIFGKHILITY